MKPAPQGPEELASRVYSRLRPWLEQSAAEASRARLSVFAADLSATAALLDPLNLNSLRLICDRVRRHSIEARAAYMPEIKNRMEKSLDEVQALAELTCPDEAINRPSRVRSRFGAGKSRRR
jgi:hypothetical protein